MTNWESNTWHTETCSIHDRRFTGSMTVCDCDVPQKIEALRAEIHTLPLAGSDIDYLLEMLEGATDAGT